MPAPPESGKLSRAQRRQIEAEELARAEMLAAQQAEALRLREAESYRRAVRAALRPRPRWQRWAVAPVLALVPLLALVTALWPRPVPLTDNVWGGISDSRLMERCRAAVSGQTYGQESDLRFPAPREAADQLTASPDGKRWDGWAARPDGSHLEFSCSYAASSGDVTLQLIQENP